MCHGAALVTVQKTSQVAKILKFIMVVVEKEHKNSDTLGFQFLFFIYERTFDHLLKWMNGHKSAPSGASSRMKQEPEADELYMVPW